MKKPPEINEMAKDFMRKKILDHEEMREVTPESQAIMLQMIDMALEYYLQGCVINLHQDGAKLQ